MTEKYRVHELVRLHYSDIGEYIDEDHTDRPLRNDELVDVLNEQEELIKRLKTIREEQTETILKQKRKIKELEQEKESWKNSVCHDMNLKSMLSFEIGKLTETKDIEKFLDFYYKHFCKINGDVE